MAPHLDRYAIQQRVVPDWMPAPSQNPHGFEKNFV